MTIKTEVRKGTYCDSVVLMQLQKSLANLPGVTDAGVVMGTGANKNVLAQSGLLSDEAKDACPDDLLIVVSAQDEETAKNALSKVDSFMNAKKSAADQDYRPRSLETAAKYAPDAQWVLVSVNGKYASKLCDEALDLNKNVFLYSDNVSIEEERRLKLKASKKGLLVMGPDCGTAIVQGVGLGFSNHVRRGSIGIVAASGTGLQAVSVAINELGEGVSQAIGTGGRDLKDEVGGITARQGLQLLAKDADTRVIVLISKPPSAAVANRLFALAQQIQKPVVIYFLGYVPPARHCGNLYFALSFSDAAQLAITAKKSSGVPIDVNGFTDRQKYLRGLFSGGTLAYETKSVLRIYLDGSPKNTVVDLGDDEYTVGRLHPMMDNDLRIRKLNQEAEDPEVAVILLDVVLGYGAHSDPAGELAPVIKKIKSNRRIEVVAVVVGTEEDPQVRSAQIEKLYEAGAIVETSCEKAAERAGRIIQALRREPEGIDAVREQSPFGAINAGVEGFYDDLKKQKAPAIHMQWSPPAGGNERLIALLDQLKEKN